ncbi:MAG TPA: ribosome biogenesis GTP-binding protein YihA/YsxC [Gemmatimonadales bacterium]|nr:ribosome biogenesis GTP-binding protein YihA/YsxC [Gemmatimonadales bacterium]
MSRHLPALPVEFVGSFPDPRHPLDPPLPEIAFLGRSNVGKSSLLNAVSGRPGLARVSRTPGRTSAMNVFRYPTFYLVDLPGYGYARASHEARSGYAKLINDYLVERSRLHAVVWLLDIRHGPSAEDLEQRELLAERGVPVLVALTKADKLTRREQIRQAAGMAVALDLPEEQFHLTSSSRGTGIADLGDSILAVLAETAP